jgi:dCTP deaminase
VIGSDELVTMLADPASGLDVTPLIDAGDQIGEGSIDIRLGPDIIVSPRATGSIAFDPTNAAAFERDLRQRQQYVRRGIGDPFLLQPGEFVIGRSLEYVGLPRDLSAEALGRSSWGRLGLVIATATLIQPGFKGTITLELANVGDTPIMLEVGLAIAQLVFARETLSAVRVTRPVVPVSTRLGPTEQEAKRIERWRGRHREINLQEGRYKLQIKPALSRLHRDKDLIWLTPLAVRYVVGVVGERFAGKSSVVNFLAARRSFRLYRLSQFIFDEARRRGLDATSSPVLRAVGKDLRERHGPSILARLAFQRIRSELNDPDRSRPPLPIVIEGFRVPEELEVWQHLELFRPLLVRSSLRARRIRAIDGGWVTDLPGYPSIGADFQKDQWFAEHVDRPDGEPHAADLVEVARRNPEPIEVVNDYRSLRLLHDDLKEKLAGLETWWRAREY